MYACWFCHISRFYRFLFLGLFCTSNQNMLLLEMLEIYMLSCKWIKKKKKKWRFVCLPWKAKKWYLWNLDLSTFGNKVLILKLIHITGNTISYCMSFNSIFCCISPICHQPTEGIFFGGHIISYKFLSFYLFSSVSLANWLGCICFWELQFSLQLGIISQLAYLLF
jgi:hypothetical protein